MGAEQEEEQESVGKLKMEEVNGKKVMNFHSLIISKITFYFYLMSTSIQLSVYLSIYLSIHLNILSIHLTIYLSTYISGFLSICSYLDIDLSIYLSNYLPIYIFLYIYSSIEDRGIERGRRLSNVDAAQHRGAEQA